MVKISRRDFLAASAATIAGVTIWRGFGAAAPVVPGSLLGPRASVGHRLRDGTLPLPVRTEQLDVAIIGGGVAGLAAAHRLQKANPQQQLKLFELDSAVGGNARSGENEISAYPWGAHYVPVLNEQTTQVRALFEELGIIQGYDAQQRPIYNEFYLCADPHERLWFHGRWQEGLVPNLGLTREESAEIARFFKLIDELRHARGSDGRRAFEIPVDASSRDAQWLRWDQLSMAQWLRDNGYSVKPLLWYLNYCCRDDYGATLEQISAWAGLHYFAARDGIAANTDGQNVVTWPAGNGFLVEQLAERCRAVIQKNSLVHSVQRHADRVHVDVYDVQRDESVRYNARAVIVAVPRYVAAKICAADTDLGVSAEGCEYAPWAVANISVNRMPGGTGANLCWDNVVYGSPLLGYVIATHQQLKMMPRATVLTYYWPLTHVAPAQARQEALARSHEEWQAHFLDELLRVHPELKGHVQRIDVWVWGHGMIRPTPGFIWSGQRERWQRPQPPIFFAHSDLSGISIFEEAYTRGVQAADGVLAMFKQRNVT